MATSDEALEDALGAHRALEEVDGRYTATDAALDNEVSVENGTVVVRVEVPTIQHVVRGARVAPVVADGWFETLSRRLEDGYDVTQTTAAADPVIERADETVIVTYRLAAATPEATVADAKVLVDFVVGTFVQGAIPGYEYGPPMRELLDRARAMGEGGTPGSGG